MVFTLVSKHKSHKIVEALTKDNILIANFQPNTNCLLKNHFDTNIIYKITKNLFKFKIKKEFQPFL